MEENGELHVLSSLTPAETVPGTLCVADLVIADPVRLLMTRIEAVLEMLVYLSIQLPDPAHSPIILY
jgi:hypothetical protein